MIRKLFSVNLLFFFFSQSILFAVEPARPVTDGDYTKISLKFRMFSPFRYSVDDSNYIPTGIPLSRDPERHSFREYFKNESPEYFSLMQSEKGQVVGNIWLAVVFGCITGAIAVNTLVERTDDKPHSATFPLIGAGLGSCAPAIIFRIRSFDNLKYAVKLRERRLSNK